MATPLRFLPLAWIACTLPAAFAGTAIEETAPAGPPLARVQVVEDTYFGVRVPDPYRWMEAQDGEFHDYLRAQGVYTQKLLGRLAEPRRELFKRIRELQTGTSRIRFVQRAADDFFFLETPADAASARIMQRDVAGGKKRVLVEPSTFDDGDRKASIDFISTSPGGRHIAFVVAHSGAEDWKVRVVDTKTGHLLDDVVPGIANPFPRWNADGSGFYYSRLQDLAADAPETAKYNNMRVHYHALGTDAAKDPAIFGPGVSVELELPSTSVFPDVIPSSDGRYLVASLVKGTDYNAKALWVRDLASEDARWRQVADYADIISSVEPLADAIHVISSRNAPNGRALRIDPVDGTIANARVVVPESDIIISTDNGWLGGAKDGLYVVGQRDGFGVIRRVGRDDAITELDLPVDGIIIEFTATSDIPGVCFGLQSPVMSGRLFCHDPAKERIADSELIPPDPADYSKVAVHRVEVPGEDGIHIPLTIIGPKDLKRDGKTPVLLTVYGSYGVIVPMWFIPPNLAWYERGGVIAFAHTRGGGEKGVAWHEAGRRKHKQNVVDDTLAAARWLIDEGYTSPRHLAIAGKSAGGLPVGAAITQRPDLFRAALIRVGIADMLRLEQSAGGPANAAEYGSVFIEEEFHALHAISPYANVRDGVDYPAVMLETGVNDPRVPPWQLAKMTARLQAATASDRPVLLRVDHAAGHGLGTDKVQAAELAADEYTFLGWQLGLPAFNRKSGE